MGKKKRPSKKNKPSTPETIPFPTDEWKDSFRATTFKTNFALYLSQPMIEFLCSVADQVHWDRTTHRANLHRPDNWLATAGSEMDSEDRDHVNMTWEWSNYRLSPAGEAVVQLFKVTGVFVEADTAISKKARNQ